MTFLYSSIQFSKHSKLQAAYLPHSFFYFHKYMINAKVLIGFLEPPPLSLLRILILMIYEIWINFQFFLRRILQCHSRCAAVHYRGTAASPLAANLTFCD